jgi:DNA-binding response OmpR family regulator
MSENSPRILVADDDPTACLLMQAALGNQGFSVTTVDNGKAAVDAFASETFAMALLDIEMPGLDGYLVCSELRRQYGESLPIILITGHDDRAAIEAGFAAGASDFISKPINWSTLAQRLRPLLDKIKPV